MRPALRALTALSKPVIAITMGDPGGIGPEVIAKNLQGFSGRRGFYCLLIGARDVFDCLRKRLGLELNLHEVPKPDTAFLKAGAINFLDISGEGTAFLKKTQKSSAGRIRFEIGKISRGNAALACAAIRSAVNGALRGTISGIVTAPVSKAAIQLVDPGFTGHTEYLARRAGVRKFAMMFVSDRLKVTLVTTHLALRKVSRAVTGGVVFDKIALTDGFLKKHFRLASPRLAVCALNPHGPETGQEDLRVVAPAVRRARAAGIDASGPLPGDQVFRDAYLGKFDAVIGMYHDQGLAPFKMVAFDEGVNVTLGLPFVRTSPDHGTAFNIAYQGKANPASFGASLALAAKLAV